MALWILPLLAALILTGLFVLRGRPRHRRRAKARERAHQPYLRRFRFSATAGGHELALVRLRMTDADTVVLERGYREGRVSLRTLLSYGEITVTLFDRDHVVQRRFSIKWSIVSWLPLDLDAASDETLLERVVLQNATIIELDVAPDPLHGDGGVDVVQATAAE